MNKNFQLHLLSIHALITATLTQLQARTRKGKTHNPPIYLLFQIQSVPVLPTPDTRSHIDAQFLCHCSVATLITDFSPLNAELNPICRLLALLGGQTIVVVSSLRVKEGNHRLFLRHLFLNLDSVTVNKQNYFLIVVTCILITLNFLFLPTNIPFIEHINS